MQQENILRGEIVRCPTTARAWRAGLSAAQGLGFMGKGAREYAVRASHRTTLRRPTRHRGETFTDGPCGLEYGGKPHAEK